MVELYPYVPIGDNVRIGVAIFSYLDTFSFGITADYSAAPDLDILTAGISHGLAELHAQPARPPPRRRPGGGKGRAAGPVRGEAPGGHRPRARRAARPGPRVRGALMGPDWHPGAPAPGWAWCSGRAGCSARPG